MTQSQILVIVITYNGMKWIDRCIQSILASTIDTNIFIIDNGSTDNTIEHIKNNYPNVKINVNAQNLGFGQANNIGLQYAIDNDYEYVYLLNQDAWVKPDTIEKLIQIQQQNPDYGILSPMQLEANEKHFDLNFYNIIGCADYTEKFSEDVFLHQTKKVYPVKRVMAAHWLISRKCLLETGGFSPSFHHYGEDDNYADRAWQKGIMVGFSPTTIGIHDRESRISDLNKKTYLRYCQAISDISGFEKSTKQSLYDFTYDMFTSFVWGNYDRIQIIKYFFLLLKSLKKLQSNKTKSLQPCAFLSGRRELLASFEDL